MESGGGNSRALPVAVLVLLLLLVSSEIGEARTCESQSHKFKGTCVSGSNCANVCHNEGFSGGRCRGFRRRCFCQTHCA